MNLSGDHIIQHMGGLHFIYMIGRRYGNGLHDSRTGWMGRWIHISSWEHGPVFDLSLSVLSVCEVQNVQAAAFITIRTVCLNLLQHIILSTNSYRIEMALTKLSLCKTCSIKSLANTYWNWNSSKALRFRQFNT